MPSPDRIVKTEQLSMTDFSNEQIFSDSIPDVETLQYEKLSRDYLLVMLVRRVLTCLVVILGGISGFGVLYSAGYGQYSVWLLVLLVLICVFIIGMAFVAHPKKGYALREKDIIYREGVFFHRMVALPYSRIQHAEVHADLIEQYIEVSSLRIYTAGGSASDLDIPGLNPALALRLREFVLKKAEENEEK